MIDTNELLGFLGRGDDDPDLQRFLVANRIHDRPKTVAQLADEEFIEDDGDTDVEYELDQAAQASLLVQSERLGFCLMFETRDDYYLVKDTSPATKSLFMLEEIALFAKGVQIYQQYLGVLPGALSFDTRREDSQYQALGEPIARRIIYETPTDLFVLNDLIVNFGFDEDDADAENPLLRLVHIRQQNIFDKKMLAPNLTTAKMPTMTSILGGAQVGREVSSQEVADLFLSLGIGAEEMYEGVCPDEITRLTQPKGITLYFNDVPNAVVQDDNATGVQRRMVGITFKRRGDLESKGYEGDLPFSFEFGDSPDTLIAKAGRVPDNKHASDQLMSYYWKDDSGLIVQAVCSLIDWQLYRITLHASFMADELVGV